MISRRNFFSILTMMAVLLFMFQFSQVIKEYGNDYDSNEHVEKEPVSGADKWQSEVSGLSDPDTQNGDFVLFLGEADNGIGNTVSQWCNYTKRNLIVLSDMKSDTLTEEKLPELILLDAEAIDFAEETQRLAELAGDGVPIIFCNLPEASVIIENNELKELLGIGEVVLEQVEVEGIHLFSGFLLGGEVIYRAEQEEDEKKQDLELLVPWYIPGTGTKTYMVGMLEDWEVDQERLPALIWRHSFAGSQIFVVNGTYMENLTGLGILSSFIYEMNPYEIYPVVNAQNTIVANYPGFAGENEAKIVEIYSRSPRAVFRDVMWPGISSMAKKNHLKLTCCLIPQYDYMDGIRPDGEDMIFYLQQMKEIGAEAGKTLEYKEGITLKDKLEQDSIFFDSLDSKYQYSAYYAGKEISAELEEVLLQTEGAEQEELLGELSNIRTLSCLYSEEYPLLSYYNDSVTLQCAVGEAQEYTYSRDLQLRSLETALGYSNVLIDIHNVMWPRSSEDQWENYFDEVSSNVSTYWSGFEGFSAVTLSESDTRVRSFLNLDYTDSREGEVITLQITNAGTEAWFVLRTHGEDIADIEGAEYQELEEDFYLIQVLNEGVSDGVEIRLKEDEL